MATIDIHCHPTLNSWLFNSNFETDHPAFSKDFFPVGATVDYPKMVRGQVDALLSFAYLPEKPFLLELDPAETARTAAEFVFKAHDKAENNDYPDQPFDQTMRMLDLFDRKIESARLNGCDIQIARSFSDLSKLLTKGTKAVIHCIEGGHSLGRAVNGKAASYVRNIDALFERGVAMLTLVHFYENDLAAPIIGIPPSAMKTMRLSYERDLSKGLTESGKEAVDHMFDIGMIADLTHCTPKAREQVFDINDRRGGRRPIVFSHVGITGMFDNPMNPAPAEILKIKECGGAIGIISAQYWLIGREEKDLIPFVELKPEPGIGLVFDMIEGIRSITGTFDNICIGSDLDGFTDPCDDFYNIAQCRFVRDKILERFGSEAAEKIMGGNALRVLRDGWGKNNELE
jgi:microsomal dipeptidase-like Zn-dependent dipeptidase